MEPSMPRGVRDSPPEEAILIREIVSTIEEIFKRFGFYPIETPSLETLDVLNAKSYGEESAKQIYTLSDERSGLRYDFTVPLARYLAMNKDTPLPFKRYQIGNIWRKDEPQRMRYREFLQADVDIVGSQELLSDAEVVAAPAFAMEELGIENYRILLNDRIFIDGVLSKFGVKQEDFQKAIKIIDKLPKYSVDEIIQDLSTLCSGKNAEAIIGFITKGGSNEEILARLSAEIPALKAEIEKFSKWMNLLNAYGIKNAIVDLSLARGLDYYTGFVWEFIQFENEKRLPSIGGGGRYDGLMELYSGRSLAATGMSLGISRILDIVKDRPIRKTYARVLVSYITQENMDYALSIAQKLRAAGIYTDINVMNRSITKQLEYANSLKFKYIIILGDKEKAESKVKLRDMLSGNEEMLVTDDAIKVLKGE